MASVPERPRPFVLEDSRFWWDAVERRELVVQECSSCGELRHPPSPTCPSCRSFAFTERRSAGSGVVHSYVVSHHPQHPAFTYPLVVLLVDLDEGFRLVAGYLGESDEVRIGQRVQVDWVVDDAGQTLPAFRSLEVSGA